MSIGCTVYCYELRQSLFPSLYTPMRLPNRIQLQNSPKLSLPFSLFCFLSGKISAFWPGAELCLCNTPWKDNKDRSCAVAFDYISLISGKVCL